MNHHRNSCAEARKNQEANRLGVMLALALPLAGLLLSLLLLLTGP